MWQKTAWKRTFGIGARRIYRDVLQHCIGGESFTKKEMRMEKDGASGGKRKKRRKH